MTLRVRTTSGMTNNENYMRNDSENYKPNDSENYKRNDSENYKRNGVRAKVTPTVTTTDVKEQGPETTVTTTDGMKQGNGNDSDNYRRNETEEWKRQ